MQVEFKKSFWKCFNNYETQIQEKIYNTIELLIKSLEKRTIPKGLGLKLLHPKLRIYEVRCGLKIRIIFRLENDFIEFGLVGTHADIKNFLKRI